ncbi:DUF3558 family protein [Streptomyces chryseus]|uniref:DUF3558 domain-containing protein n=1 Tax=Streptomyces chryseus TaxID=68186 RepID=A0ABQ3EHS7_9ACTN|nr:DUF3558 family protein [Streptomyces chryseus]GHB32763.1 hypothetical protein GCM10010346_65030 [Streptomyces chryseus]
MSLAALALAGCSDTGPATTSDKSGDGLKAPPIATDAVDEGSICKVSLTADQQKEIGVWEATPESGEGEVTCYFSMTPDTDNPTGYVVSVFQDEEGLLQTVDGTDASPTKAVPVEVKGRMAAQQIMYGDDWRASLTVDIGSGQFLFVERYSPKHVVAEKDMKDQAHTLAEQVLGNLQQSGKGGI